LLAPFAKADARIDYDALRIDAAALRPVNGGIELGKNRTRDIL
jgi:hypothetical protein